MITDSLGCKDTSNVVNVTIASLPNVTVPQSTFTACFSGGPTVVPAGNPSGGVWSGLGMVNDSVFDPTVLGPGPSLITYTYANAQGCIDDAIRIANTVQTPPLILSNNLPSFCEGDGPYSLGATVNPSGGNYSGPGVSGTTFNPVNAGVGTHLIRYKYSVAQNCEDSVDFYLVVNASPTINYPDYDSLCDNISSTPLFSASPFGGTYSGPFVIGNNFYPFFSGAGSFPITYTVTENGCTSSSTKNIHIDANINVQLSSISDLCINDAESVLDFGFPTGGNYKIDGVLKDSLKPSELGIGTHTIEYELTNSCGNSVDTKTFEIFGLPNVSAGTDAAVCIGGPVTLVGSGASTYTWDNNITNAVAFIPTSSLTYKITGSDVNGCTNTDSLQITVNDLPNIDAGQDTSICEGQSIALNASGALTYNWENNITNATAFTPISTTLYTVTGTDNNGCINTDQVTITLNNNPLVSLFPFTPICNANSSTVPLTGGFPAGGNYDGLGVTNNNFSPYVSGAGFHNITYTFSDSNGCSSSDNKILVVDTNNVNISLPSFGNLCENSDSLVLSGGTPSGGFYSGNSVNNDVFYPDNSGSGSFTITYSYLEANTCLASTNSTITVSSFPLVNLDSLSPICLNNTPFVVNGGSPAGGFYYGNGINNGIFYPQISGIGNFNINYIFTDSLGCTSNSETSLNVKPLPNTTLSSFNDLCIDANSLVLTSGIPVGGTYSGNGVNNGIFYPDSTGIGNFIITYTGELNGCFLSDSQTITVNPLPTLSFGSIPELCVNDSLVLNFMSPTGGNYSGNNISNGIFYSSNTNIGINNFNYTYTDSNSCTNNENISLLVNDLTSINLSISLINEFCFNDSISVLNNYLPIGGTYSGNGISNNLFNPSLAGIGQQLVNYEFIDSNGCLSNILDTFIINTLPVVNLSSIEICENSPIVALNNGLPTGGTFSGIGISNGSFNPININPGNSTLIYLITDSNNCSNSDTSFIKINPNPIVSLNLIDNLCRNDGLITLSGGQPLGGNYSSSGVSGNILNTTALNTGINYITYSYTDNNSCSSSSVDSLNILQEPTISISGDSILCFGDTCVVSAIGGLNYLWSNGDTSNTTTSLAFNSFFLSAIGTDSNGCQNIDSIFITVNDLPQVTINAPDTLCSDSLTTINVVSSANQFLWNNNNTNAFIQIGPFNYGDDPSYFLIATDSNGCYNSDSTIIIIENCEVLQTHDLDDMDIIVFPNPNNGFFTIELNNYLNEEIDISFISSLGQIVNQQKFNSNIINFNVPYLSSGIYSLIIKSKNQYLIKKVIIQ
ncbi:T9SS type A sorting domain-containing protein [bacterium]|nr:T9SS type A sorting domain-containing protein [bacterium]